jgi:hypothetical protein
MSAWPIDGVRKSVLISRLVLLTFVGPCPEGMVACRNDGNPGNNRLSNLRYDTHAASVADAARNGRPGAGRRRAETDAREEEVQARANEIRRQNAAREAEKEARVKEIQDHVEEMRRQKAAVGVEAVLDAVKDLQALGSRVGGKEVLRRLLDLLP